MWSKTTPNKTNYGFDKLAIQTTETVQKVLQHWTQGNPTIEIFKMSEKKKFVEFLVNLVQML